jgi:hypothetical protein
VTDPQDVMRAGSGQLAASLVQADTAVTAALEAVDEVVAILDESAPAGRGE